MRERDMDATESNASSDAAESIGCELIAELVRARGGVKVAARPARMSPETVRTWAEGRRKPGFDAIFEMMVYDDFLFQEFLSRIESRRAGCQTK
jgi:hypothetical protein